MLQTNLIFMPITIFMVVDLQVIWKQDKFA